MLQVAKKIASCNASSSVDRMNTNSKTSTFVLDVTIKCTSLKISHSTLTADKAVNYVLFDRRKDK